MKARVLAARGETDEAVKLVSFVIAVIIMACINPTITRIDSVQTGTINSKYATQHVPVRAVQSALVLPRVV